MSKIGLRTAIMVAAMTPTTVRIDPGPTDATPWPEPAKTHKQIRAEQKEYFKSFSRKKNLPFRKK